MARRRNKLLDYLAYLGVRLFAMFVQMFSTLLLASNKVTTVRFFTLTIAAKSSIRTSDSRLPFDSA